jgi:hypothetical protein
MAVKKQVATSSDLDAHIREDWKLVHGIWTNIRPALAAAVPTQIATPTDLVSVFTWDGSWHDADLSSYMVSTARWAILSIGCRRTIGNMSDAPQFGKYGETTAYIVCRSTQADDDDAFGGVLWVPMDTAQRFSYKLPSNDLAGNRVLYLLGYV